MSSQKLSINSDTRIRIYQLQVEIEKCNARQTKLLSAKDFAKYCKDRGLAGAWHDDAEFFWQLGLLKADIVHASELINLRGLVYQYHDGHDYIYTDERRFVLEPSMLDIRQRYPQLPSTVRPLFHPYRYFVMYWIYKCLDFGVTSRQPLTYSLGCEGLVASHLRQIEQWFAKSESARICNYRDDIAALCGVMEPGVHRQVFNKIKFLDLSADYQATIAVLNRLHGDAKSLLKDDYEEVYREIHRELCMTAQMVDGNRDVHTVIRLMSNSARERIKGTLGGAHITNCMAETLRRIAEDRYHTQWNEEDESGFGVMRGSLKQEFYGAERLLDGGRVAVQQFLRQMGLDYALRMVIYVEGETEYAALRSEFSGSASVDVVNLNGRFVERGGRGLAFRESLRRDLKNKLFSMILLDGDRTDNVRVVRKAAEADEFCGRFFVSTPDVEYGNFGAEELVEIVKYYLKTKKICVPEKEIEAIVQRAKSGKELQQNIREIDSTFAKGEFWGRQLIDYAVKNSRGDKFGDKKDRPINQVLSLAVNAASYNYEITRQRYRTCPETGRLVER